MKHLAPQAIAWGELGTNQEIETMNSRLSTTIPANHVRLLYWVRTPSDTRDTASTTGNMIIPSKGCIKAAEELDSHGRRDHVNVAGQTENIPGGHGVTILFPSGRRRNVRM